MTAALYIRVSKDEQHIENQLPDLEGFAQRHGWDTVLYTEHASGKAGSRRPALEKLMADAAERRFDVVLVWKIDRFGRSLSHFIENVRQLDTHKVRFIATTQGIDTDERSPFSRLLMHVLAVFAEFERDLIVDRVRLGLKEYKRAYAAGNINSERPSKSRMNLPIGRPKRFFDRSKAQELRTQGKSWRAIAEAMKVPVVTVRRAVAQRA